MYIRAIAVSVLSLALFALGSVPAAAEGPTVRSTLPVDTHRWGVEIDLIQPFIPTVNIIRPKVTRTLWGPSGGLRGDLIVGAYLRPNIEHDILFRISEYMATVGYRQYLWRGLHVETMLSAGIAWGTNRFDGKYYETPSVFVDALAGYRFAFFEPGGFFADRAGSMGLFVTVQAGILTTVGIADIGPRDGKPDWFPQGNLLVGTSF